MREALARTTDNHARIAGSIRAYFDFVNDPSGAHQLVLESDLRSEPAVRMRVEDTFAQCVRAIAATIVADTGLSQDEAELLAVGLVGLAESGSRWWLLAGGTVAKERAVESMVSLAWRGIAGYPRHATSTSVPASTSVPTSTPAATVASAPAPTPGTSD